MLWIVGTEPVVLSACDVEGGEIRKGEGVYGLWRAFQEAGVHYVWSISDIGTQVFVERFYQGYLKGTSHQQALRDTQLKLI